MKTMRYKVQQDQGKYCLKGCDDGDLVDWSQYEHVLAQRDDALNILAIALPGPRPWPTEDVDAKLRIYHNIAVDRSSDQTIEKQP